VRHWEGETSAVVRDPESGATHLIGREALAVIEAAQASEQGASLREIAHDLAGDAPLDAEMEAGLQRIIDGLLQSGLLHRADDQAVAGREVRR
jgi:PqqD family protein of HPr-rel-A system